GRIDAIAARLEDDIVAAGNKVGRRGFGGGQRRGALGGIGEARRGDHPVDDLVAGGSGNAESGAGGGYLVFPGGGNAIVLAGFIAWEELLIGPTAALIHHVKEAIEVGAEFEADA